MEALTTKHYYYRSRVHGDSHNTDGYVGDQ